MRWPKRQWLAIALVVLAFLCAAASIRSIYATDVWQHVQAGRLDEAGFVGGSILYERINLPGLSSGLQAWRYQPSSAAHNAIYRRNPNFFGHIGFAANRLARTRLITGWIVAVPLWFVIVLSMIWPTCWWIILRHRRLEKRRQAEGLCLKCGYDLRGSPQRCPECGMVAGATQ